MYVCIVALLFFVLRGDHIMFCLSIQRLFCHQIPSCPICLYPPTAGVYPNFCISNTINISLSFSFSVPFPIAAKITRCGHVYCWSCVLHYLALVSNYHYRVNPESLKFLCLQGEKKWRKCPICYESIYKQDLKRYTVHVLVSLVRFPIVCTLYSEICVMLVLLQLFFFLTV